ncbi:hypothetical protein EV122DRAFT_224091 [Schizophyllum commune]
MYSFAAHLVGFDPSISRALGLKQLRKIVRDQLDNICQPLPKVFQLSRANKPKVVNALLDPKYSFSTCEPKLMFKPGYCVPRRDPSLLCPRIILSLQGLSLADQLSALNATQGKLAFSTPTSAPLFNSLGGGPPPQESSGGAVAQMYNFALIPLQVRVFVDDADTAHLCQTLIIYIWDVRDITLGEFTVLDRIEVTVPVVYTKHNKYIANWRNIIREIQGTASTIRGRYAKLSYSRSFQDNFKIVILQADDAQIEDASITHRELLLDGSPEYCLHVDPVSDFLCNFRSPCTDPCDVGATLQHLSSLGKNCKVQSMVKLRTRGRCRQLIEEDTNVRQYNWLLGELRKRDGYEKFRDTKHNTKMYFAEVLDQWCFAVDFMDEYKGHLTPCSKKRVLKRDIQDVLDRGQNWLSQAKKGHGLYDVHRNHPEVVAALQDLDAKGHAELYELLKRISQ